MVLKEEGPTSDIYESTNDESPLISSSRSKTNRTLKIIIALLILLCVLCIISTITLAVMLVRHKHAETFHKKKRTIDVNNFIYFFQITDVHLDVLYSKYVSSENWQMCRNMSRRSGEPVNLTDGYAEFGRVGCDAPEALVKSAAKYMEEINGNLTKPIDFIIISGDQSAHGYHYFNVNPNETTLDSINTSMRIFGEAFPDVPIIPGLGNNDLFIDYLPPVANDSTLYMDIRQIIEPYLFLNSSNTKSIIEEFRGTFDVGGFYKYTLEGRHLVVLVLNTNYWSVNAYNKNSNVTVIGDIQIRWLNTELHAARQQSYKVIINGHIPPGCDSFDDKADWLQNYTNTYTFMVSAKYKDLIAAQLYGHHHKDKIHMLYTRDEYPLPDPQQYKTALLMSPSITPIYKNSPAFRLFAYNQKDGNLYNYTQYYMDLASSNVFSLPYWKKEYSFVELYNKTMTSLSLAVLTDEIADPASPTWPHYRSHIYSLNGGVLLSERFKEYCEAKHVSLDSYTKCIEHYKNYGEV